MEPEKHFINGSYAGIGSRRAHPKITKLEAKFGFVMCLKGVRCNSGRAYGSDFAFETGARLGWEFLSELYGWASKASAACKQIVLPWEGFNGAFNDPSHGFYCHLTNECYEHAKAFHPSWGSLTEWDMKLMARNSQEILGINLTDPVRFVVAHTDRGLEIGGTAQALRIAAHNKINIYNLGDIDARERIERWIESELSALSKKHNVDLTRYIDDKIDGHIGVKKYIYSDIIQECESGNFDVLIQMLSCQNVQGEGLAKNISMKHPEVALVNKETKKGDKSKLGGFTSCTVNGENGHKYEIINLYGQFFWGREEKVYADYDAIRKGLNSISKHFHGRKIAIPKIGSGYAQGCWMTISNIIENSLAGNDVTLVINPSLGPYSTDSIQRQDVNSEANRSGQQQFRF